MRSIFERCQVVWRPSSNTTINKLESIQKLAIKWINQDYSQSYSSNELLYHAHCKQLRILPVRYQFNFYDLKLFHLIVHQIPCIKLPSYLGSSRLRFTHLDHLCIITETVPAGLHNSTSKHGFANSYFYRTHLSWNRLPLSLREIISPSKFKIKLLEPIWKDFITLEHDSDIMNITIQEIGHVSDIFFLANIYRNLSQHASNSN